MLYNSPLAVAALLLALLVGLYGAVRFYLQSGRDKKDLDRAEEEGRLSPVIREIWESDRRAFGYAVLGLVVFFAWLLWAVDHDLGP